MFEKVEKGHSSSAVYTILYFWIKKVHSADSLPQNPRGLSWCPLFLQNKYIIRSSRSCKCGIKESAILPHSRIPDNPLKLPFSKWSCLMFSSLCVILTFIWLRWWRVVCKIFYSSFPTSTRSWIPDFNDFNIIITATSTWATFFLLLFPLGFFFPKKQHYTPHYFVKIPLEGNIF